MGLQSQVAHLRFGDRNAGPVLPRVELGLDAQSGNGPGVADELDDRLECSQGLSTPVLGDVTEQPMVWIEMRRARNLRGPVAVPSVSRWASIRLPSSPRFRKPPVSSRSVGFPKNRLATMSVPVPPS
jgi:hypothetical protein